MLKSLLLSTQKIKEQKKSVIAKNLCREKSPSLISPPPLKNRRYSSVWSAPTSPFLSQQYDIIDDNLNNNCSTSATALVTVLSSNLENSVENNASRSISDIKNSASLNSEKFINQLNQNNNECLATTSSCSSSLLKIKNEDEEMDENNINFNQQQQRHSIMFSANNDKTFECNQKTINCYKQQHTQLQNIEIAAGVQQQKNSTVTKLNNFNDNILNFTYEQQAVHNLNNLLSSYALLSDKNNFNGSISNQLSTKETKELNLAQHFLLPSTANNIPATNSNIFSNVFSQSLSQTCSSSLLTMQTLSSPLSTTSLSPSATNAQTTTSALGCSSSSSGDQTSSFYSFDNNNLNGCRPIRSRRTSMKDITTLDNPAELEEFMQNGEESCINDMKQFITQFSLRQTTVAMMTGVSQPYISKLLNGNHRELSMRCRKNIYSWYLNCRRHPAKLALFTQDPSSRLETNGDGELIPQRRERYVFRPLLIKILEAYFAQSQFPDNAKRMEIAQACNEALKMNKKGVQLMPKEVVTPQVIANWFANKRKENRRKSHDETGSLFNAASLTLGLTTSSTFNIQNTSQHYQEPPSSAPSALAFQLSNVGAAGSILDSLQQSSFQHQSFFENISSSIHVANSDATNNSPQFLLSPLSATENTSSNNDCNKLSRRESNVCLSLDANKTNIINDNNKYTSAILANIEAFRAAAAISSTKLNNNNNNSENKSVGINEFEKKNSFSQNILDNILTNQQNFDFMNQNNFQTDVVIENTTSSFLNEDKNINNLSINKTLQISQSSNNSNKINFEYINENNNNSNFDNDKEENKSSNSKNDISKINNHNDYENYNKNFNNLEDFYDKFNEDNKSKILPLITTESMFVKNNVKNFPLLITLQKNIQNEKNEKCKEINLTIEEAAEENQNSKYYKKNSDTKNLSLLSNNNRLNMASIFQSHLQQHDTKSTFHHENNVVVEQQKICHQQQQLVAE